MEILLLSGGTPYANFRDLAHAWGRERSFHTTLAMSVFERRGDLERKRRSDAGKPKGKRCKTAPAAAEESAAVQEDIVQQHTTETFAAGTIGDADKFAE